MNILLKNRNGHQTVSLESSLMLDRKVFLEGHICPEKACEFTKIIMQLNKESSTLPIDLLINSTGGEINSGMLIYDVLQASKAPVRVYCIGMAYSMAAIIFASGRNGRYMLPHSELMLHEPLIPGGIGGSATSVKSISDSLLETRQKINQLLAKHTGRDEAEIEEATRYDHFFGAFPSSRRTRIITMITTEAAALMPSSLEKKPVIAYHPFCEPL